MLGQRRNRPKVRTSDRPKRCFAETAETETPTKNLPKQPNRNGRNCYKGGINTNVFNMLENHMYYDVR